MFVKGEKGFVVFGSVFLVILCQNVNGLVGNFLQFFLVVRV